MKGNKEPIESIIFKDMDGLKKTLAEVAWKNKTTASNLLRQFLKSGLKKFEKK